MNTDVGHKRIAEFCRRIHIARLSFFGSVLHDDFTSESDVDVLAAFEPSCMPRLFGPARIRRELGEIIGRSVDFKTAGLLGRYIRDEVLAEAQEQYVVWRRCDGILMM